MIIMYGDICKKEDEALLIKSKEELISQYRLKYKNVIVENLPVFPNKNLCGYKLKITFSNEKDSESFPIASFEKGEIVWKRI